MFLVPFLPALYLLYLLGDKFVVGSRINLFNRGAELAQFFANTFSAFLFGLCLLNLTNGCFYTFVAFAEQFFGLFFRPFQYIFPCFSNLLDVFFITFDSSLQFFFLLVYGGSFVFPIAFVAHNVLQILVALYIVFAHNARCGLYYLFGQPYFACNLDGKRTSWLSDRQREEGLHLLPVVEHGSIGHALMGICKVF